MHKLLALILLTGCADLTTGASSASDPAGPGVAVNVDGTTVGVEAGRDGMGVVLKTSDGQDVRMGVVGDESGAVMGMRMEADDGTIIVIELGGDDEGPHVHMDVNGPR